MLQSSTLGIGYMVHCHSLFQGSWHVLPFPLAVLKGGLGTRLCWHMMHLYTHYVTASALNAYRSLWKHTRNLAYMFLQLCFVNSVPPALIFSHFQDEKQDIFMLLPYRFSVKSYLTLLWFSFADLKNASHKNTYGTAPKDKCEFSESACISV